MRLALHRPSLVNASVRLISLTSSLTALTALCPPVCDLCVCVWLQGNGGMIFLEFGANTCGLANGAFRFDLVKQLNPGPVPVMQAAASSKVCNGRQLSEQTLSVIKRGISDGTIGKSKVTAKSTAFRFLQVSQQFSVLDAIIGHIFEKQTDDYDRSE